MSANRPLTSALAFLTKSGVDASSARTVLQFAYDKGAAAQRDAWRRWYESLPEGLREQVDEFEAARRSQPSENEALLAMLSQAAEVEAA